MRTVHTVSHTLLVTHLPCHTFTLLLCYTPQLPHTEHMAISKWLTGYKLVDYISIFEACGYETTELLVGVTSDELQEMGISKIGHRKKIISALDHWHHKEHFFQTKPVCNMIII